MGKKTDKKDVLLFRNNADRLLKSNITVALLVNTIFFLLVIIFCDLKYEVSDDFIMSAILSGAFGDTQNPHMFYVNVVWGYFLIPFYKLWPRVSWYFVTQILLVFLSSVSVTYVILERTEKIKAMMLSMMLILFFSNDAYILVQFTKTAMYAVMAGAILFIWALFEGKKWHTIIMGGILCLAGTTLRFPVIYMAGGFILFILVFAFWDLMKEKKDRCKLALSVRKIVLCGAVLIVLAYGLNYYNDYVYRDNGSYELFSDYSSARGRIIDTTDYGYWAYADELQKLGISENDYAMIRAWGFADNDVFDVETLQQVGKIIEDYNKNVCISLEEVFEAIQSRGIIGYPVFIICIVVFILGMFFYYNNWWKILGAGVIGAAYILYFFIRGRAVYRTEYAVFLGVFLCTIYFWKKRSLKVDPSNKNVEFCRICVIITTVVCIVMGTIYVPDRTYRYISSDQRRDYIDGTFFYSWNFDARKYRRVVNKGKPQNGLLNEIENNKDHFYFLDFGTTIQTLYYEWKPWENLQIGYFDNSSYLAGITTNFPDTNVMLKKRGLQNPLKSLVNDNVYLIDNRNVELKLSYLREHYYSGAKVELYKEVDGYKIWKFYKE